jgi:arginine deiminase
LISLPEDLFLEGGDVIPFSREGRRTLLVGHGPRSSREALFFLQQTLIPEHADEIIGIELSHYRMNLDGGLVPVCEDVLVAHVASIGKCVLLDAHGSHAIDVLAMFRDLGYRLVESTQEESIYQQACNCLCLGDRKIIYYDLCDRMRRLLEEHDVTVITVEGSELVKGRGGPRCMTRPFYRAAA